MMFLLEVLVLIAAFKIAVSGDISEKTRNKITNYPCQIGSFPLATTTPVVCAGSGLSTRKARVSCQDGGILKTTGAPKEIQLERPLGQNYTLILLGTPLAKTSIIMALFSSGKVLIRYSILFSYSGLMNRLLIEIPTGSDWQVPTTVLTTFPYTLNMEFNTTIHVQETEYKILVDDVTVHTFALTVPSPSVSKIGI